MDFDLRLYEPDEWAGRVADELTARLRAQPALTICLPTGDTPAPLYAALADAAQAGRISFEQAIIVLLDEYVGLPPDDPARCDVQLRGALLERLPGGPRRFHPIRVDELPPPEAATAHDRLAGDRLDLALVGLGRNGHVGFNEPGSTADSPTRVVELSEESIAAAVDYGARARPRAGITLGLQRLLQADEIWLLVTGEHKAEVLRIALEAEPSPDCPASLLRRHPRLVVFADRSAAQRLSLPGER